MLDEVRVDLFRHGQFDATAVLVSDENVQTLRSELAFFSRRRDDGTREGGGTEGERQDLARHEAKGESVDVFSVVGNATIVGIAEVDDDFVVLASRDIDFDQKISGAERDRQDCHDTLSLRDCVI